MVLPVFHTMFIMDILLEKVGLALIHLIGGVQLFMLILT